MLRWRLLSASILISIAVALAWLDYKQVLGAPPGAWMIPLYLTVLMLGTHEMLTMFANKGWHPVRWPVYGTVTSLALLACFPILINLDYRIVIFGDEPKDLLQNIYHFEQFLSPSIVGLAFGCIILIFTEIYRFDASGKHCLQIAASLFTIVYLGILGSFFAYLRMLDLDHESYADYVNEVRGMAALLSTILIVKMSDVGAYLVGRAIGRNKLAPKLSPGKTYEGAFGGLLTAGIASLLFFKYAAPQMVPEWKAGDPGTYVCYGILLGAVGIVGDLAESMLKREMGVKDSGNTLPGLGGVLDVLDSMLFAAPVAYVCWELGLLGQ